MAQLIPRDRFFDIHRNIHFADAPKGAKKRKDMLIHWVLEQFNANAKLYMNPGPNVCIDDTMVPHKAPGPMHSMKPKKPHRNGTI